MSKSLRVIDNAWLVVPLYNEGPVVAQVIREARKTFPNVVCVDDGSTDDSADLADSAGAYVVRHPINLGQGAALQTGIDYVLHYTDAKYLVTFDADGQHRAEDAAAMIDRAEADDLAIVYGSRFLEGGVDIGFAKRLVLRTAAMVTRWQTGLRLTDAHNGLRLLRRDAAASVQMTQDRMAHASEIISQLSKTDFAWAEMPVHIDYTEYSRQKGQSLLNSVNILIDLVLR